MTNRCMQFLIAVASTVVASGAAAAMQTVERESADVGAVAPSVRHIADAADPPLAANDWTAIQSVIGDQLAALRRGDATRAFGYASTGIRDQFDDATTFLLMVRQRYGVLLTARYTEFLEGAVIDGHTLQPLRLVMNDDTVLVAIYEMQRDERGGWRIAGCVIAPSTVRST